MRRGLDKHDDPIKYTIDQHKCRIRLKTKKQLRATDLSEEMDGWVWVENGSA